MCVLCVSMRCCIPYSVSRMRQAGRFFCATVLQTRAVRGGGYDWVYGVCVAGRGVSKGDIGLLKVGKKFYIPETPGTPMC